MGSAEGDTVESMSAIISRERGSVEAKRVMFGEKMRKVGREAGRWEIRQRKTERCKRAQKLSLRSEVIKT